MANKRIKKKQTKASILQQQYTKEYNKYLARVRNQQKQGVQVERIKRVKKPTQASIERLQKQTAKEIRERASVVNMLTGEIITSKEQAGIKVNIATPVLDYEAIIDSWYDSLESFAPKTAHWLRQKTDALLANASEKERALFAYTYAKEPEAFPTEPYMDKATVDAVFWNILRRMGVLSSTEDFQGFLQEQDIVIETE